MSKLYLGKSGASNFLKLVSLACKSTVDIVDSVSSIPECDQSKVSENDVAFLNDGNSIYDPLEIAKQLVSRSSESSYLLGTDKDKEQVDKSVINSLTEINKALNGDKKAGLAILHKFNKTLGPVTYLVSNHLTLADIAAFAIFAPHVPSWNERERTQLVNVSRWYDLIQHHPSLENYVEDSWKVDFVLDLPKVEKKKPQQNQSKKTGSNKKK